MNLDMLIQLKNGIRDLNIDASEKQIEDLLKFIELLKKWNKVYNLTALKTEKEFLELHILDSLTIFPYLEKSLNVLDVGSGAGLPGIPLAIMFPEINFTLLDSNTKKTRFIQQAVIDLKLKNCKVVHDRIELFKPNSKYDTITTRAFAEINDTIEKLQHFSTKELKLLFMKSKSVSEELKKLNETYDAQCFKLSIPGLDVERYLIVVSGK